MKPEEWAHPTLSKRAARTLAELGMKTREETRAAIEGGKVNPFHKKGVGPRTVREILEWCGLGASVFIVVSNKARCPKCDRIKKELNDF